MRDLADIRVEIDQVDKEILDLFTKRMELACQVAQYKLSTGKGVYDKARENEKLDMHLIPLVSRPSESFTPRLCLLVVKSSFLFYEKTEKPLTAVTLNTMPLIILMLLFVFRECRELTHSLP